VTSLETLAHAHYIRSSSIARSVVAAVLSLWALVDSGDIDASWTAQLDKAAQLLAVGQFSAAGAAAQYVREAALAQGVTDRTTGSLDPRAFTGMTADGRTLASMLALAGIYAKAGIGSGMPLEQAMGRGGAFLALAVANETQQAGRNADHVAITATKTLSGYTRILNPPSCSRCVILAGKWFHWNQGFARHPHCDCIHVPAANTSPVAGRALDPRAYFNSLTEAEQNSTFGADNAASIRDGADMNHTVNLTGRGNRRRSGLADFDVSDGTAATSRAGLGALYRAAGGDRDQAVELLTTAGYLTAA
jgi:hypothetical protein